MRIDKITEKRFVKYINKRYNTAKAMPITIPRKQPTKTSAGLCPCTSFMGLNFNIS